MPGVSRGRRLVWATASALLSLALAACGSSGGSAGNANQLLTETFSGVHTVNSGNVNFTLTIVPSGSNTPGAPITLSLGGPFQSLGAGKLPESNFAISFGGRGKSGSVAVLSTGSKGYVTLQGTSYELPPATFQKLQSSFAQVASTSSGSGSGWGALGKLGINPMGWLRNPTVVGNETIDGTSTTHIRAGVNTSALVNDLSTFLQKASSVSGTKSLPGGLSATAKSQIVSAIQSPSVNVWTGSSDKTLRKLQIGLTVPATGQLSTLAGGAGSAAIGLKIEYAELNQPQKITAPTTLRPFSEFQRKLQAFMQAPAGLATDNGTGSSGSGGSVSGSSGAAASGSAAGVHSYSQCIQAAGNDVSGMQKCSSLLSGG